MSLRGHVDQVTHYTISGWALDEDAPEKALNVIISIDGAAVGGAVANRFRKDLTSVHEGSTGNHAFEFSFDPSLSLFRDYAVEVTFERIAQPLPNGKKSLRGLAPLLARPESLIPILVTAMGRSGTSVLMNRLASCEDITVAGEFPFEIKMLSYYSLALRTLVSEGERERSTDPDKMASEAERFRIGFNPFNHPNCRRVLGGPALHDEFFLETVPAIIGEAFRDTITKYYDRIRLRTRKPRARYIAEKILPDTTSRLVPRFLFGGVKEIVLVRDPRDLLCSFDSYWKFSGDDAIHSIASTMRALAAIRQERRDDTIIVKFEDLVLRQAETLKSIAAFLGVDGKLDRDISSDGARFINHGTARSPEASIGRWKSDLSAEQIERCLPKFGKYLALFGYET
jgi:Sulfotransferase family